jgi:DNA repair protein SbcD/Mre11
MPLNILHTADWHLGQTFYEYDRSFEHVEFLLWLKSTISEKEIDVLLISGDIFDVSNPSAASMSLFYRFLKEVTSVNSQLQIICIAGNHDSAARLEAPKTLLEVFNVSVVGSVEWTSNKAIDYEKLTIPLNNRTGTVEAYCLAIPFLRPGDYPGEKGYAAGIESVYHDGVDYLNTICKSDQAIVVMGHLHTLDAKVTEDDKSERKILGGLEYVPLSAFSNEIVYTALGHIHRPQEVSRRNNVRYAGSPLPMSFSELNYRHQVVWVKIESGQAVSIESLEIPVTVKLLSLPSSPQPLQKVIDELQRLPEGDGDEKIYPYLQVRVKLDGPEPSLRHQVEAALSGKAVRLARIEVSYPGTGLSEKIRTMSADDLQKLRPYDMLERRYKARYNTEVPAELATLFNEVTHAINNADVDEHYQ